MRRTDWIDKRFRAAEDKLKGAEKALAELEKIAFPTPGIKVTIAKLKLKIRKMKMEVGRIGEIYVEKRNSAVRPSLHVLKESTADSSYVGSARSEEAYRIAHKWLNSYNTSSGDSFYQQVQMAVTNYAKLRKS